MVLCLCVQSELCLYDQWGCVYVTYQSCVYVTNRGCVSIYAEKHTATRHAVHAGRCPYSDRSLLDKIRCLVNKKRSGYDHSCHQDGDCRTGYKCYHTLCHGKICRHPAAGNDIISNNLQSKLKPQYIYIY